MWLDILALVLLCAFALMGAVRGALASSLSLVGLGVAYAAAIALAVDAGALLAAGFDLSPLLAVPIAGTLVFVGAFLAFGVVAWGLRGLERHYRGVGPRTPLDRAGGALFGATRGFLIVLLIGWLALWLDAARTVGQGQWLPETGPSTASQLTQSVIEAGAEAAFGERGSAASAAARFAARPAESIERLQSIVDHPLLLELRDDGLFWSSLELGDVERALEQPSFARILDDASLRRDLSGLGLISDDAAHDPRAFRREASDMLHELAPRLRALRQDPELQRLVADPDVQRMVESGNTLGLLAHPGFRRLVERILLEPPERLASRRAPRAKRDVSVTNYRF
ncbi:MAG: CvpA family protein [Deltaproteobacteria bacterium]|nr:MAG: CvpA family protein [Deltaproteobacteria bacterium]